MFTKYITHISSTFLMLMLALHSPAFLISEEPTEGLPLFYWSENPYVNFGDYLSLKIVERIVDSPLKTYKKKTATKEKILLALGSILSFARDNDVIWGSGVNGKLPYKKDYGFRQLDVRAVRGPITREFLWSNFQIDCPEIYGDPALLVPYLFPEFKRSPNPKYDYIVIPHFSERDLFPKNKEGNVIHPTDPWDYVIKKILDSKFVISSSLHGIVVAEAFGIPARLLRATEKEYFLKYQDYYFGTNRPEFQFARSVEEALIMGGEPPAICDLKKLYDAFPFDQWPHVQIKQLNFSTIENNDI